jgi:putative transposase
MPEKFQNKYRISSARLKNWDYGSNGAYFITICTKEMQHLFGEVIVGKMNLNNLGKLAEEYRIEIAKQFPYVELGNFQIMPNHMHGILIINKSVETRLIASNLDGEITGETRLIASVQSQREIGGFAGDNNPMLSENISRIIRWYKGKCTFEMRKVNANFEWHSRFYDHIIRNSESFERIQNYIVENPSKWNEDKFYKNK